MRVRPRPGFFERRAYRIHWWLLHRRLDHNIQVSLNRGRLQPPVLTGPRPTPRRGT